MLSIFFPTEKRLLYQTIRAYNAEISTIRDAVRGNQSTAKMRFQFWRDALESIYDIAHASKRIVALYFGGVDMAAELRCENSWENLLYARSKLVHAAASIGVDVLDVPYLDLENMEGMKKEAELAKNLGFSGKGSIHPKQIDILNKVFTPSKEEIDHAKKIVDQFNSSNTGLVVIDGKLIEKPVLREMQRKILIADKINKN